MIQFSRMWAMPSADTFSVPPIGEFVKKYLRDSRVSVDPFARNKQWATYTNDLNPDTASEYHMDALDFLKMLKARGVVADLVILDPPYSLHQVTKTYMGYGDQRVNALTPIYDLSAEILSLNGVVLNFGFNTNGIARRGFEIEEILIVAHGGHHNDTICMAERKIAHQMALLEQSPDATNYTHPAERDSIPPAGPERIRNATAPHRLSDHRIVVGVFAAAPL